MTKLLCPFCGKVAAYSHTTLNSQSYVRCNACNAQGPLCADRQTARNLWQRVIAKPEDKPEDGWLMVTQKLAQRIRELDNTVKLEMVERAKLAERLENIEANRGYVTISEATANRWMQHLFQQTDTTHDREGEQDG